MEYRPSSTDYGLFEREADPPSTPTRYRFVEGRYYLKMSPAELAEFRTPAPAFVPREPEYPPPTITEGYDFDEAFPQATRAHVVIDGEVNDAKALRNAARHFTAEALGYIVTIMRFSRDEKVKLQAADLIMNRAIGKPVAPTGVMEGDELKEALGSIVLPEKRRVQVLK